MGKEIYSLELKLEVVKYVLEENHTRKEAADKYGVTSYPIEKWINLYCQHGEKGLKSRNNWNRQHNFTGEFKLNVLKYMERNHLSYTQTAAVFCIDLATVSKWAKLYREEGTQALFRKRITMSSDEKTNNKKNKKEYSPSDIKQLQEENRRLHMENDYLKKLNALVQEKEKSAPNNE